MASEEYFIRRSEVEKIIDKRLELLELNAKEGTFRKALKNSIINLSAVKADIEKLDSIIVRIKG